MRRFYRECVHVDITIESIDNDEKLVAILYDKMFHGDRAMGPIIYFFIQKFDTCLHTVSSEKLKKINKKKKLTRSKTEIFSLSVRPK